MQEVQVKYETEKTITPLTIDDINYGNPASKKEVLNKWRAWNEEQRRKDTQNTPTPQQVWQRAYYYKHKERILTYLKNWRKKRESKLVV